MLSFVAVPIQVYVLGPNSDSEAIFYTSDKPSSINEKITFVGKNIIIL